MTTDNATFARVFSEAHREEYEARVRERDEARAALDRVRALHNRTMQNASALICRECGDDIPCPTIRAIDGDPT